MAKKEKDILKQIDFRKCLVPTIAGALGLFVIQALEVAAVFLLVGSSALGSKQGNAQFAIPFAVTGIGILSMIFGVIVLFAVGYATVRMKKGTLMEGGASGLLAISTYYVLISVLSVILTVVATLGVGLLLAPLQGLCVLVCLPAYAAVGYACGYIGAYVAAKQ